MAELAYLLQVNHDELEAKLETVLRVPDSITDRAALDKAFQKNNVLAGIDEDAVRQAFAKLVEMEEPGAVFLVASGKRPRHGKDGQIDFKLDVSGKAAYKASEEEGATVDFREATKVISVKPGDLIAELLPPVEGEDGHNLAGKPLPAKNGKPAQVKAGEGVAMEGTNFVAKIQGRPLFFAGNILVSPLYQVDGDVDFSTGNIKFDGHVVVNGNVQDDFTIEAGSVEIMGVAGAATIKSRGPLDIRGGVNGRDKAEIYAEGATHIKYVNQAKVTVLDNLVVAREIVNSRIWCRGKVRAEKIIGGECLALGGVEASLLGSEMGVSTVIEPGANFEVRKIDKAMESIAETIEGVLRPVAPFFGDRARYKGLPEEKKAEFRQAFEKFAQQKEAYVKLAEERATLLAHEHFTPVKEVIVRKLVYPDVFVRTDMCMKQFKTQVTGPVALIEDIDASTIRPANYTPGRGIVEDDEEDA